MKKRNLLSLIAIALVLASCKAGHSTPKKQNAGTITSVSVDPTSITLQEGKQSSDITVTVTGTGDYNKNVKLVSEDETIAYPSFTEIASGETFKVRPGKVGATNIKILSIQDETIAANLAVEVKTKEALIDPEITSVIASIETKKFYVDDAAVDVGVVVSGKGLYDNKVTVTSSNTNVVSVDKSEIASGETFKMSPVAAGNATIDIVSKQDAKKSAQVIVKVENRPVEPPHEDSVLLDDLSRSIMVEDEVSVSARANGDIVWSLEGENADKIIKITASSNESATVLGLSEGNATLVATVGTKTAKCAFEVKPIPTDIRKLYFTNNLGFEDVYFYAWNDKGQTNSEAGYPGVKLTSSVLNNNAEDCYEFTIDILKYPYCLFNNGLQGEEEVKTIDVEFRSENDYDNIYFLNDGNEGTQVAHYTYFVPYGPAVSFASKTLSLFKDETKSIAVTSRLGDVEYNSSNANVEIVESDNGSLTLKGLSVGETTITATIPESDARDELTVKVLDPSLYRTYYFSNNRSWERVYLYAWASEESRNADWPGIEITEKVLNNFGQSIYKFVANPNDFPNFILNNGVDEQTENLKFSYFKSNDNVYINNEDLESPFEVSYAKFEPFVYDVKFSKEEVTVYNDKDLRVLVTSNGENISYSVVEGTDVVSLSYTDDSCIKLHFEKAGEATIKATLHDASCTVKVTCVDEKTPVDVRTLYFSNNRNWKEIYLFAFSDQGWNKEYPGVSLLDYKVNMQKEECAEFTLDVCAYDYIILNDGESNQTIDIALKDFGENNNVYIDPESENSPFNVKFATFNEYKDVVEFAEDEVTVYNNKTAYISVSSNGENIEYSISEGKDFVELKSTSDTEIALSFKAAGKAKITATLGNTTATLDVTVVDENAPVDMKNLYFTNNRGWENVYIYAWGDHDAKNAEWPGIEITETKLNSLKQVVYAFSLDLLTYSNFIVNNGKGAQSEDIAISDLAEANNVFIKDESQTSPYEVGFANFEEFVYEVSFEVESVNLYRNKNTYVKVTSNFGNISYEVIEGSQYVEILPTSDDEEIGLKYIAAGKATIKAICGTTSKTLVVDAKDEDAPTSMKDLYFTNNKKWENVYLYTWGNHDAINAEYPGVKLSDVLINSNKEDVYSFAIDVLTYDSFLLNDGTSDNKTEDIAISSLEVKNNVFIKKDAATSPFAVGLANFVEYAYEVSFAEDAVTVYNNKNVSIDVTANFKGVSYEVTSGAEFVNIESQSDTNITLKFKAAGEATIKASVGKASDTLTVTCVDENAPVNMKELCFTNNKGWENVYLYAWGPNKVKNAKFPGVKLEDKVRNSSKQDVYNFSLDSLIYENFLLSDGTGDNKTTDIALSSISEDNNIYIPDTSTTSPYAVEFAKFSPFVESISFTEESVEVKEGSVKVVQYEANDEGATFEIIAGTEYVEIKSHDQTSVTLAYKAEGEATLKATLGKASATIKVTCTKKAVVPADNKTFYFSNNKGWEKVYCYAWKQGSDPFVKNADWPGTEMTYVGNNEHEEGVYSVTLDLNTYDSIIFTDNKGNQTITITLADLGTHDGVYAKDEKEDNKYKYGAYDFDSNCIQTYKTIYLTNNYNWSDVYCYAWNDADNSKKNAEWPGVKMTYVKNNNQSQGIYKITINTTKYDHIIFTNNNGQQTVNIAIADSTENAYWISGGSNNSLTVGTWNFEE